MADRRYGSMKWKRVRLAVLRRDGYECQIRGPRCRGTASTVHHVRPSSQYPELFWSPENLEAACSTCNYAGGANLSRENRRAIIEQNDYLERQVREQRKRIVELESQLARRPRAKPAIR